MSTKKSLGFSLVVLGFVLLALAGIRTISNPEMFTHIALGQSGGGSGDPLSYTMVDQAWINMHPIYNKLVSGLWELGGAGLLTLVHVAALLSAFVLMFHFGKKWGGSLSHGFAILLCTWLLIPVFNPGPAAFALLFTALFLTILYRVKNFNLVAFVLIALQILWTNMHPSFLFGPVLIFVFAIENWQETQNKSSRKSVVTPLTTRLFVLFAVSLLVTLVNPNIVNLHTHIFSNWRLLTGTDGLEWISLFSGGFPQSFVTGLTIFALILGAGGLITLQKKLPLMITLLALVGAFLTVRSIGTLLSFSLLSFPFMILSFNAIGDYLTRTLTPVLKTTEETLNKLTTGLIVVLMIFTAFTVITNGANISLGSASSFGLGVQEDAFPVAAAEILARDDFPERIMNMSHDGGYLAMQNPQNKIFCDTRISLYGTDFYKMLNKALLGQAGAWKTILSDWNPHAVVLNGAWPDSGALANRLISSKVWKMVYFDGTTIILIRDLPEYETLINDPAIQKHGGEILAEAHRDYQTGNKGIFKTGNSSRLLGAGGLYLALNRPLEAEAVYSLIVKNSPNMATAWLGLGQTMILQKKLTQGITYMEKAATITPRNARVWMGLLQGYRMKNDRENVTKAAEKLNKFYQAEEATIEQQEATTSKNKAEKKPSAIKSDELELPSELR